MVKIGVVTFPGSLDDHDAIRAVDPVTARAVVIGQVTAALDWLVDEKVRLEASADLAGQGAP